MLAAVSPGPSKRSRPAVKRAVAGQATGGPKPDDAYDIQYFRRHADDDPSQAVPGQEFLASVPTPVRANFRAVLVAVAKAPPHKFSGGGKWEAMSGNMKGIYEVRVDGPPNLTHCRLFCVLDTPAQGSRPILVVIDGDSKKFRTEMPEKVYKRVRERRDEYLKRPKRSLA
jgi:hypothetical protein